jgi:hypothetical protein
LGSDIEWRARGGGKEGIRKKEKGNQGVLATRNPLSLYEKPGGA